MEKIILVVLLGLYSSSVWADKDETFEYCKHKYEQVSMDVAYENSGCQFSEEKQKLIIQNRNNTFLNCFQHLDDQTRSELSKQSKVLASILIKKFGKDLACKENSDLYPAQIYN